VTKAALQSEIGEHPFEFLDSLAIAAMLLLVVRVFGELSRLDDIVHGE
jgi:hypothetical protein